MTDLTSIRCLLGIMLGGLVGLVLGLFGGGGSILAVPLMVYVVGIGDAHLAVGTSALAVAANAATSLLEHARHRTVKWRCAAIYSAGGTVGALLGSSIGKMVDGQRLLFLFALLMLVVGVRMFQSRADAGVADAQCTIERAPKVVGYGAATGALSGFFGIGGGFLIVPGLMASTGMQMIDAVGTSLFAVCSFGLTTALNYAAEGWVDWPLAILFVAGGAIVGCFGGRRLSTYKGSLKLLFACLIFGVALYMIAKGLRLG